MFIPGMSPAFLLPLPGVAPTPVRRPLLPLTMGPALDCPSLPCFPGPRLSLLSLPSIQSPIQSACAEEWAPCRYYLTGKRERAAAAAGGESGWIVEGSERVKWSGRSGSTHERRCLGPLANSAFPLSVRLRLCSPVLRAATHPAFC